MYGIAPEPRHMDYPVHRRKQLAAALTGEGLDALLVTNPVNVSYLTGFSGESSYLIVGRDRTVLVSDARFAEQIEAECPGLEVYIRPPAVNVTQAAAETLQKLGHRAVGYENLHLTVGELESLQKLAPPVDWKGGRERVEQLRAVKDASEVAAIREAIAIAERAFEAFRALLRPDDCEKDLSDALETYVRRAGGRCTSFPSIVAVGERAALPHAPPTAKRVAEADFLLVDWGASGPFYKSDLTRVLATRNNPLFPRPFSRAGGAVKLADIYTIVLEAQAAALRALRPGVKGQDVDAAARAVIAEAGYGDYFGHGLGHGIGLQVHEAPALRPGSEVVLQAGMVVTVEPGIYLPGHGGVRIEDDVLVTPDGGEVLTSVAKEFSAVYCPLTPGPAIPEPSRAAVA
jgi:Xaa-Pro aminopeptidase